EEALALDDSLPRAWYVLGINQLLYEWKWAGAEEAFRRAVEAGPDDARGHVGLGYTFAVQGNLDKGIDEMTQATKLDPLSPVWTYGAGMIYYWMRKEAEATEELGKSLEIDPKFLLSRLLLGQVHLFAGRLDDALREFSQAARDSGDHPYALGFLAHALAASSQKSEAEKLITLLGNLSTQRYVPPLAMAVAYLGTGEIGPAFDWLNRAVDEREPRMTHVKVGPLFDPLHPDSRFQTLLCRVGLPQ
ncbi:MAG: tetratricopeptide repeat protein, partial [Acidobacteriota bacterium]|nr:tetratricopeptide repeat protein [Acidobacteriota bacterium]